jgi:glycosyltransferase involved in cell wall biosynthesis
MTPQNQTRSAGAPRRALRRLQDAPPSVAVIADEHHAQAAAQLCDGGIPGYALQLIGPADAATALGRAEHDLVQLLGPDPRAPLRAAPGVPVLAGHALCGAAPAFAPGQSDTPYDGFRFVLSPTRAADATLSGLGVPAANIVRWTPGVDRETFGPARYGAAVIPAPPGEQPRFHVLVTAPLSDGSTVELLALAMRRARKADPRLQLVLAGGAPPPATLAAELVGALTWIETRDPDLLARVYASADLLISPERGEAFGHDVLRANASGLPAVAIEGSGAAELVEPGRNGCVVAAEPAALGDAVRGLARRAALRERLSTGGLITAREHGWPAARESLAAVWDRGRVAAPTELTHAA